MTSDLDASPRARHSALPAGVVLAAFLLLGIGLRVAMACESFWFDEVWSWQLAQLADDPASVLTRLRHDNNHPLNTWWLQLLGPAAPVLAYRALALACGIATLPAVWALARPWGETAALFALAGVATSAPLVSVSAQARGYAPAILCGLVFVWLLRREHEDPSRGRAVAIWVVATAGTLAHPTFVYVLLAAFGWSAARGARPALLVRCYAVPVLVVIALYLGFYAHLEIGGGPDYERGRVLRQAVAAAMGLPRRSPAGLAMVPVAAALLGWGLWCLRAEPTRIALLLVGIILAAPALVVLATDPPVFYARYLVGCIPWFVLAVAAGLATLAEHGARGRLAAWALLALLLLPHLVQTGRVLATGRGDYARTLAYLDRETAGNVIEVASDHDTRNRSLLRFHARDLRAGRALRYVAADDWPPEGTEWYLRHSWRAGLDPEASIRLDGVPYRLVASFPHGPGEGFQWFVYRRTSPR